MNKQNGFLSTTIIIIILLVLVVGLMGYIIKNQNQSNSSLPVNSEKSTLVKDDSSDKDSNSEIYTNQEYGFSFTIPEGWKIEYDQRNDENSNRPLVLSESSLVNNSGQKIDVSVFEQDIDYFTNRLGGGDMGFYQTVVASSSAIIDGKKVIKVKQDSGQISFETGDKMVEQRLYIILAPLDKYTLWISYFSDTNKELDPDMIKTLDNISDSLKFD